MHCKVHVVGNVRERKKNEHFRKRMFSDRKRPTELLILTLKKNKAASQVVASDVQAQTDPPALASLPGSAH